MDFVLNSVFGKYLYTYDVVDECMTFLNCQQMVYAKEKFSF